VLPGNTADNAALKDFLGKIEDQYGKADRIWAMDRGIPTEEGFEQMRASTPPVSYLVGTPKGRLTKLEAGRDARFVDVDVAYALQVTPKARLRRSAGGLTPRAALEKFAAVQMLDVHLPTTDGREIILSRCTHPEEGLQLLLGQLKLTLPGQPLPGITAPPKH